MGKGIFCALEGSRLFMQAMPVTMDRVVGIVTMDRVVGIVTIVEGEE